MVAAETGNERTVRELVQRVGSGADTGPVVLTGARLAGLDLRGARLAGWRLHDCTVVDCRFDGSDCDDWRLWNTRVAGSVFDGASLRGAALGTVLEGARNEWSGVHFGNADLSFAVWEGAVLRDCDFAGAQLDGAAFVRCAFENVRFAGPLRGVVFDGRDAGERDAGERAAAPRGTAHLDLGEARLDRVDFYGLDLAHALLPADPDLVRVAGLPGVLRRAVADLEARGPSDDPALRVVLADLRVRLAAESAGGHPDDTGLVNRRDIAADAGDGAARLMAATLERAAAATGDRREDVPPTVG